MAESGPVPRIACRSPRSMWARRAVATLAVVFSGCTSTSSSSTTASTEPVVTTPAPTTVPVTTAASTSTSTTVAPTTTATTPATTDPRLLAGERVLCTFSGPTVPDEVLAAIADGRAAGVLLFKSNLASQDQARSMTAAIQTAAAASPSATPAIVAVDQEGGIVARIPGPPSESAATMGGWAAGDIRAEAAATATNLRAWGINLDLAPVADVARPGGFEDRQHRSFSQDPAIAAPAVAAFVEGLHDGGVAGTLKHFPGLGSVGTTTDDAPATVPVPMDELTSVDLVPFRAGIEAGVDAVMMSSAVYSALDGGPAVTSSSVVDGLLRRQLQFDGVVVSDALDTPALTSLGSVGDRGLAAANAGVDLLIAGAPTACGEIQSRLASAIADGTMPLVASQASADRVLALRHRLQPPTP